MGTILVPLFAHYRPTAPLVQAAYAEGLPWFSIFFESALVSRVMRAQNFQENEQRIGTRVSRENTA